MRSSESSPPLELLTGLGQFAASIELDKVPRSARHQATLCILDTIGCIVLGADTPDAKTMLAAESARGGKAEAAVFGTSMRLPVESAARVNGYLGDIFELNDLLAGHPSIATVPTALAVAEARGSSGAQLLKAVIAGIETTSRTYAAFRGQERPYPEIGNGFVGFMNTLGAAAAASSLLGLDARQTADALAIAGALAGWCPAEALFRDGGTIKPMLFGGWPASVGIQSAGYAAHGLTGPRRVLEGDFGFFGAIAYGFDAEVVLAPGRWYIAEPRRKLHACCGYMHSAIDLAAALRLEHGKEVFRQGEIEISMTDRVIAAVSKERPPSTPNEARFHLEYCVAVAAAGADVVLPKHSTEFATQLADPEIQSLMRRIRVKSEPAFKHYHECAIELIGPGGESVRSSGKAPKGSPANPLTDDEVVEKFKRLVSWKVDAIAASAYAARVQSLESEPDCRWLATALM